MTGAAKLGDQSAPMQAMSLPALSGSSIRRCPGCESGLRQQADRSAWQRRTTFVLIPLDGLCETLPL